MILTGLISPEAALASNVSSNLVIGIQSSKTLIIRPFEPVERDLLSAYDLVYESLITIDDSYLPQGKLAEGWEQSSNGKTWTFYIRPGVTFSDGSPLTAQDVVASAQYILERANDETTEDHGFYANLKYFVNTITAQDEQTVVVRTKRPYYGLLYAMTFPVVPAPQVREDQPLGSGPYVIRDFAPGDSLWLEANPNWWKAQPKVRSIFFSLQDTPKGVIDDFEYARVDTIFSRSLASAQYKSGTTSLTMSYRTNQLECLFMNNSASELTLNVRRAIRAVIDRSKIISNVYMGLATPANFPFYPGTWMYNDGLDHLFTQNLEEARQLLEEEGWGDADENGILDRYNSKGELVNLHLRFYVYEEPDNDVRVEAASQISQQLLQVGISSTVESMSRQNIQEKLSAGSFDLALISMAMDVCPDPGFMLIRGNTGNYNRYKSDRMTELCESLRTQPYQEGYREKLMEIQSLFYEDCPFLCLYWRMGNVVTKFMYTTARDVREYELLRGIETFHP